LQRFNGAGLGGNPDFLTGGGGGFESNRKRH
jgi:hypothetical protein